MPLCLKCNQHFAFRTVINGVKKSLQNRKYCLDCSPFGQRNTKILDPILRKEKGLDNPDCVCQLCNRPYVYGREGHTKNICNGCMTKKRRNENQSKIYEYKGSACVHCGYHRCLKALSFHHVDPENKSFGISGNTQRAWDSIKQELDKCVLLCSICHTELHEGLIDIDTILQKEQKRVEQLSIKT
jgi:hypothetical protein